MATNICRGSQSNYYVSSLTNVHQYTRTYVYAALSQGSCTYVNTRIGNRYKTRA